MFILLTGAGRAVAGQDILRIMTGHSGTVMFNVELATTVEERRRGLMHRNRLAQGSGMLFDYGTPKKVAIWMKNTSIPLDILFIDRDGVIVKIHQDAKPYSLDMIKSGSSVLAVLEINAGLVARHSIQTGDRVDHPVFER